MMLAQDPCASGCGSSKKCPRRMAEFEERVDFTERIVAKTREPDRLHQ